MRHLLPTLLAVLTLSALDAQASPFVVSDPQCYDETSTRAECPTQFEYSDDGGSNWYLLSADNDGTQIWVYHDIGELDLGQGYSWLIRSTNVWGTSDSIPFDFTTGVPVGPTGLRLEAKH